MGSQVFASARRPSVRSAVLLLLLMLATVALPRAAAGQDPVLEWNTHLNTAVLAGGTGPLPATRVTAMVQAAVFDAVNGIARRPDGRLVGHWVESPSEQYALWRGN